MWEGPLAPIQTGGQGLRVSKQDRQASGLWVSSPGDGPPRSKGRGLSPVVMLVRCVTVATVNRVCSWRDINSSVIHFIV